jgi:hypothetical protein
MWITKTAVDQQIRHVASLVSAEQAKMQVEELTEAERLRQEAVAQRSREIED